MRGFLTLVGLWLVVGNACGQGVQDVKDVLVLNTRAKLFRFYLAENAEQGRILKAAAAVQSGDVAKASYDDLLWLGRYLPLFDAKKAAPFVKQLEEKSGFAKLASMMQIGPELRARARSTFCRIGVMERRRVLSLAAVIAKTPPQRWRESLGQSSQFIWRYPELFGIGGP